MAFEIPPTRKLPRMPPDPREAIRPPAPAEPPAPAPEPPPPEEAIPTDAGSRSQPPIGEFDLPLPSQQALAQVRKRRDRGDDEHGEGEEDDGG